MRIAISCITDAARSGHWQYLRNTVRELQGLDRHNEYLLFVGKDYRDDFGVLSPLFRVLPVPFGPEQPLANIAWHALVLPRILLREGVDLLHLPWSTAPLPFPVVPTVFTIHDLIEFNLPGAYSASRMAYRRMTVPLSARKADHITTPSQSTKEDIIRLLGVQGGKITVIPNGVHPRFHPLDRDSCKRQVAQRLGLIEPFILYVGQIMHPHKNLVRLIQAFDRIKGEYSLPHRLLLAGKCHRSASPVLEAARQARHASHIIFTGYVADDDLALLYNAADLFVYPSLFEGFGIPLLEAMASGCPVVTSNRSSLSEVAGDSGFLINPEDEWSIMKGIAAVLKDESLRKELIRKGLTRALTFSWEDSTRRLLAVYKGLA